MLFVVPQANQLVLPDNSINISSAAVEAETSSLVNFRVTRKTRNTKKKDCGTQDQSENHIGRSHSFRSLLPLLMLTITYRVEQSRA